MTGSGISPCGKTAAFNSRRRGLQYHKIWAVSMSQAARGSITSPWRVRQSLSFGDDGVRVICAHPLNTLQISRVRSAFTLGRDELPSTVIGEHRGETDRPIIQPTWAHLETNRRLDAWVDIARKRKEVSGIHDLSELAFVAGKMSVASKNVLGFPEKDASLKLSRDVHGDLIESRGRSILLLANRIRSVEVDPTGTFPCVLLFSSPPSIVNEEHLSGCLKTGKHCISS
ncbi:hypothetical protein QBC40DRAFT_292312 [Triangularia verruculosa]|uniref:Uncharacterized protein n=1 Tax=Triangularia verruculosa TaxID=2587418 RepID=A0AAN7B1P7_9PEZI|nr:hypothetical protein QBC40DRAFT_292312 [Triangularia verruculosa]